MNTTVEVWGRGANRVIAMCEKHEAAPPTFEERSGFLIVTFKAQMVAAEDSDAGAQKTTQNGAQKTTQKILDLIIGNPQITRLMLAERTGISPDGVKYHLRQMQKKGAIRRVGPDKGGHWEVVG